MITKLINTQSDESVDALDNTKEIWNAMTFGGLIRH